MRSLPGELRRLLRDAPRIGCQFFAGHSISEPSWSKFIAANDGKLSKEIAEWEKWERLPENKGYCRFFGRGHEKDLALVEKAFTRGDEILKNYDEMYPVPEELEWKLPVRWDFYPEEQPHHLSLLKLLAKFTEGIAYYGNGDGILLEEAGMEVVKTFDADDPLPFEGGLLADCERGRLSICAASMIWPLHSTRP